VRNPRALIVTKDCPVLPSYRHAAGEGGS
jgi:hypothetical protein